MIWWGWLVMGAILFGAELMGLEAQFFLVFLGLAAIVVGLADMMGGDFGNTAEWIAFAILSLFFLVAFRKSLYMKIKAGAIGYTATIDGDTVDIDVELNPGDETRASYRGSEWTVRNTGTSVISAGSRVRVVRVDGVKLHVE